MRGTQPFTSLAKAIVERAIANCDDPAERKERVLLTRECGVLSYAEAADWFAIFEVQAA